MAIAFCRSMYGRAAVPHLGERPTWPAVASRGEIGERDPWQVDDGYWRFCKAASGESLTCHRVEARQRIGSTSRLGDHAHHACRCPTASLGEQEKQTPTRTMGYCRSPRPRCIEARQGCRFHFKQTPQAEDREREPWARTMALLPLPHRSRGDSERATPTVASGRCATAVQVLATTP